MSRVDIKQLINDKEEGEGSNSLVITCYALVCRLSLLTDLWILGVSTPAIRQNAQCWRHNSDLLSSQQQPKNVLRSKS